MAVRYYISLPDPGRALGGDPAFSFDAHGAEEFAAQLQHALRTRHLFDRWRARQEEPDEVDPGLGVVDDDAMVNGRQDDLSILLVATSSIPGQVLKHRLRLLAGHAWELRDVSAA
ncbi:hypothetical protein J2X02_001240 [Pseudoxanthomonas japonensis]|uniref:hypothetical protein n=1 Tax=Pseudoxanthomonas japonensis TaxID=69284 RepID=UPI002858238B|nr:hypothetical protein [Pseudoxanthomonas japonensis]MDR7068423.1 hypothetical protein [Pseudoxanthomonas japonensis]